MVERGQELPVLLNSEQGRKVLHLGKTTFYRLVKNGKIPAVRVGRKILVPRDKLLKILE